MKNMTVREFIDAFVAWWSAIRVMHFPETGAHTEVLFEGAADSEYIPDDVGKRIVSRIIAIDCVLCIVVYKEDEQ